MVLSQQFSQPFVRGIVEALPLGQAGVYALLRGRKWIFIGSGDIRQGLLNHLNGDHPCVATQQPTHWAHVVTPDYVSEEKIAILAYDPVCNRNDRVG
jgi:hypothetical protein